MNKRNILIVAMLAMILMGSVMLSAAVVNVHNVHSNGTLTLTYETQAGQQSISITIGQITSSTETLIIPLHTGMNTITATQGNRTVTGTYFYNGSNEINITLPGPWEKIPGQEYPQ